MLGRKESDVSVENIIKDEFLGNMLNTKELEDKLKKINREELLKIKEALNNWNWPELLGEKPKDWDRLPNYRKPYMDECNTKEEIIRPYMEAIRKLLNTKH